METLFTLKLLFIIILSFVWIISGFRVDFKDLKHYLSNEKSILDSFDKYLSSEEHRISRLRQIYENFKEQNAIALEDKDLFISHPNDVYHLIKRITIEWETVEKLLEPNKHTLNEFVFEIYKIDATKFNLTAAIEDYEKIVYFYESDVRSAANGVITYKTSSGGEKAFKSVSNQSFDSFDFYSFGKQSLKNDDLIAAKEWLKLALKHMDDETSVDLSADILEHLSLVEYKSGNYDIAIRLLNDTLEIAPDRILNKLLLESMELRPNISTKDNLSMSPSDSVTFDSNATMLENVPFITKEVTERSDYLCLGQTFLNESMQSKLKCFHLNTTSKPYLRLTRVRVEELYKRPHIVLIHNFLSPNETEALKNISIPFMERMWVVNHTGDAMLSDERIAEGYFLYENETLVKQITRRISAITGLNASDTSADGLNVIHYNVGGNYQIHHDTSKNVINGTDRNDLGTRIATWINYFSEVEAGGATVFPMLNISMFPEKYSAIFWYNRFSSGEIDYDLVHTGCPVLYGEKYIATRWIRSWKQDHLKCGLNPKDSINKPFE